MSKYDTLMNILETATEVSKSWSNKQVAQFHYFNPNGLIAAKRVTDEKISKLVEEGKANSGAIIAYGSLSDFYYNRLSKLVNQKAVRWVPLAVTLKGLRADIEMANEYIAKKTGV